MTFNLNNALHSNRSPAQIQVFDQVKEASILSRMPPRPWTGLADKEN